MDYDEAKGPTLKGSRGNNREPDLMRSQYVGIAIVRCEDCRTVRHEHHDNLTTHRSYCTTPDRWDRTVFPYNTRGAYTS